MVTARGGFVILGRPQLSPPNTMTGPVFFFRARSSFIKRSAPPCCQNKQRLLDNSLENQASSESGDSPRRENMAYGHEGGFRPRGNFGGPREMHDATCSDCGQTTKVPFKPAEGRPVYCRDCYMKRKQTEA